MPDASTASIRLATEHDVPAITRIVDAAYAHYVPRIGRKPAPMLDDHGARARAGQAWVFAPEGGDIAGVLVLIDEPDHLLLDNVAVDPARRGGGVGRALLTFAEAEARRRGYPEIRLYTNEMMTENIAMYARIGYRETGRGGGRELRPAPGVFRQARGGGGGRRNRGLIGIGG